MKLALSGAYAVSYAMKQINPDVVPVYPITPQTPIVEKFAQYVADGLVDTELIRVESEHSVMASSIGASSAGARVMTASSSVGLALMFEVLGVASGQRLPILMSIANRALSGPINIHCDHSDSMDCRDIGWIQIYSENPQEAYDNTIIGLRLAETVKMPVMVMQDGFYTSHSVQPVTVLDDNTVKSFIGEFKPIFSLLDTDKPVTVGPLLLPDYYMENKKQESDAILNSKKDYLKIVKEYSKVSKRKHNGLFEEYFLSDAEYVIVVLSSTAGTVKNVIDFLREKKLKVGLLRPILFRPFPYREICEALKHVKAIAVLDRSESFGAYPPLCTEIKNALYDLDKRIIVNSYVFGLGGRDLFEKDIEQIFKETSKCNSRQEIKYVGVR